MNKYSVLAISVIILIGLFSYFQIGEDDETVTGFASDIRQSNSGYVFFINDPDGNSIKSFSSFQPDILVHSFHGNYSSDGSIFFVSGID